jgi:YHYH protein
MNTKQSLFTTTLLALLALPGCGGGGGGGSSSSAGIAAAMESTDDNADTPSDPVDETTEEPDHTNPGFEPFGPDITNLVLENSSPNCADYAGDYTTSVLDIQRSMPFEGAVLVETDGNTCSLFSNGIPNHDFNDASARFATNVSAVEHTFTIPTSPEPAQAYTDLSQRTYDAVILNGVVLDLLSAGCYRPTDPGADASGNVPVGCNGDSSWLLDPLSPHNNFGTDQHNAHTQPNGRYHYHGNPMALFDDNPGPNGSPVIGFAADGYPIYGSYFLDPDSGQIRKAVSGHTLKAGQRPTSAEDPGGSYDGMYIDDYEFTDAGDLDACNGMTVNDQYGYYVTDSYPWVVGCFRGEVQTSFFKM